MEGMAHADRFGDDAAGGPEIESGAVGRAAEEELGGPVAGGAYVGDFLVGWFGGGVVRLVGDAEVGEVGWAGGGGEEDVGGLDVAVDDAQAVDVGEGAEEGVEVGAQLGFEDGVFLEVWWGGGEEGGEVEGHEGEGEDEGAARYREGGEEGDDRGVGCGIQDADFAVGIVWRVRLGGVRYFEGEDASGR